MDVRIFTNGKLQLHEGTEEASSRSADTVGAQEAAPALEALVASRPFVVFSVGNCEQCEELSTFLAARGIPPLVFEKWDRSSVEYPALKVALARYAGNAFSFPQAFAEGAYQGGLKEVMDKAKRGGYDALFERAYNAEPSTLQCWVEQQAIVVFSLPNCPQCDVLHGELEQLQLPVKDIFLKLDKAAPEYPALKAQLAKLIGREHFSFPQVFIHAIPQGTFDEVMQKIQNGAFSGFFFPGVWSGAAAGKESPGGHRFR